MGKWFGWAATAQRNVPSYYNAPRLKCGVRVGALIFDEQGQMLLASYRKDSRATWTLPGGWLTDEATPESRLERACHDEIGCVIAVGPILHAARVGRNDVALSYACKVAGDATPAPEIAGGAAYFAFDQLPAALSPDALHIVTWAFAHRSAIKAMVNTL